MGAFISRQPNGLLCRFSTIVDTVTNYNMTDEEYIEMCAEKARAEAKEILENHLYPFEEVLNCFAPNNMTIQEFRKCCEEMGYIWENNTNCRRIQCNIGCLCCVCENKNPLIKKDFHDTVLCIQKDGKCVEIQVLY